MKTALRKALRGWQSVKIRVMKALYGKAFAEYMEALCKASESANGLYMNYRFRPLTVDQMILHPLSSSSGEDLAVILQGPVVVDGNYTLETARVYRRTMPRALIVLSTWKGTPPGVLDEFRQIGVEVITSDLPGQTGVGNVNYQVRSTMAGLLFSKERGAGRALKTRSDQRLMRVGLPEYFDALLSTFPLGEEFSYLGQKRRMVFGQGTRGGAMFLPFFLSDFYVYGDIDDLISYFAFDEQDYNCSRSEREVLTQSLKLECSVYEYHKRLAPEVLLARSYVTQKGEVEVGETLERSWAFIKSNLVCVSHEDVQLHWPKYQGRSNENQTYLDFSQDDNDDRCLTYNWTFANWLSLYAGEFACDESYESLAKLPATKI